jgi:glycosyltransferase involved in cell wall biosynthesis
MIRILHVIDSAGLYGAEAVLLDLAEEQREMGDLPVIASIGPKTAVAKPLELEARRRGIVVVAVRTADGPNPLSIRRLCRVSRSTRADVIHSHGYKGNVLLGALPRALRPAPVITTVHGYTQPGPLSRMSLYLWADRLVLPRLDRVVLVHADVAAKVGVSHLARTRWVVVENGMRPWTPRTNASLDPRVVQFCRPAPTLGAIGRLSVEKGLDVLVEAFRTVVDTGLDLRLVILGEGGDRARLEGLIREHGLGDRVLLPGYVEGARDYLPLFAALIHPSFTEGLPITILEAMQAGVPVVATSVGGVPDILDGGSGGILVEPRNARALAEAIERAMRQPDRARGLADTARKAFGLRFSSRTMATQYRTIYSELLPSVMGPPA